MTGSLAVTMFFVAFSMLANRLASSVLTAPMAFLAAGALVAETSMLPEQTTEEVLHVVAEVTLVVLLFLDAAQVDQKALLRGRVWPARMLLIGLPLTVLFGTALGLVLLPGWPLAAVALLAAILAPTDAALGQPVVSNPAVPERPRRALIVESGLNDGLALPLVLLFATLAAPMAMAPPEGWFSFGTKQIVLGPLVGIVMGWVSGQVLIWAKAHDTTSDIYEGIGALALAGSVYIGATMIGGNGFLAAFCAGLGFGAVVRGRCAFIFEFTESEGQLLSWLSFLLLGAVLVPDAVRHLTPQTFALILASLFLVRPLAIWLSMTGTSAKPATKLFFGWFGPRGLATALFALLVVEQLDHDLGEAVLHLAVNAVWISALLHGLSAAPGARLYASILSRARDHAEHRTIPHSTTDFAARAGQPAGPAR